jgi:hypothetical protein
MRMLRVVVLSAAVGVGLTALASSAYADASYWQGDPNAPGPTGQAFGPAPMFPLLPFVSIAPQYQTPVASGPVQPYWLGDPNAPGPAQ